MSQKNLFNKEAVSKLKELAEGIDIAIMETKLGQKPSNSVPMSTKAVDSEGCIWFLSNQNSEHNADLSVDDKLQLIYSNPGGMEFLVVYGQASVLKDRSVIERYYGKTDDAWFNGIDDPNLTAIKVAPETAHYWDTKNGKVVSLVKMGIGALTGKKQDLGEQGDLNI